MFAFKAGQWDIITASMVKLTQAAESSEADPWVISIAITLVIAQAVPSLAVDSSEVTGSFEDKVTQELPSELGIQAVRCSSLLLDILKKL